jgi:hypothetical protein
VRVAVSGSHSVGKSTLIAAFLSRHPEYAHEPEAPEFAARPRCPRPDRGTERRRPKPRNREALLTVPVDLGTVNDT